ncbi:MAG: 50S ribosomal protein L6 [Archaeoglobaceae archaeon]|nr:50S ribosomal protein L6 [Archaeoglobaceae archaeon]MDW7989622.1 50S ribosomal protein L6 [Archaeoglobaceae archaeon]
MSTEYANVVKIPEMVEVSIEGNNVLGYLIKAKGPLGENFKVLKFRDVFIEKLNSEIKIYTPILKSKHKAIVGTFTAHLENLIRGVKEGFEYKLKAVYAHFPMKLKVSGSEVIIENFLGEGTPRRAKIIGRAIVEIKGQEIVVKGVDIEECGQTAANLERATRIKNKDRRVFQDGIYIVKKP